MVLEFRPSFSCATLFGANCKGCRTVGIQEPRITADLSIVPRVSPSFGPRSDPMPAGHSGHCPFRGGEGVRRTPANCNNTRYIQENRCEEPANRPKLRTERRPYDKCWRQASMSNGGPGQTGHRDIDRGVRRHDDLLRDLRREKQRHYAPPNGDFLYVSSGGTAVSTVVSSGGVAEVFAGGKVSFTTGEIRRHRASLSAGTAVSTTVNYNARAAASSGGTASATFVQYGAQIVSSGGTAIGGEVRLGAASQIVSSGGTAISTTRDQRRRRNPVLRRHRQLHHGERRRPPICGFRRRGQLHHAARRRRQHRRQRLPERVLLRHGRQHHGERSGGETCIAARPASPR